MGKRLYIIRLSISAIILLLIIIALLLGFYPLKILNLQFLALFQRNLIDLSLISAALFLFILVLTLLFGRLYCSLLCPLGILQEFILFLLRPLRRHMHKKNSPALKSGEAKYFTAACIFGLMLGAGAGSIKWIDPYAVFSLAIAKAPYGLLFIAALIILLFFKSRFFCTHICPVGVVLGLLAKQSIYKLKIDKNLCTACGLCAINCPANCIDYKNKSINNEACLMCLSCQSLCPRKAISAFGARQKPEFNPKRRDALTWLSAIMLLGAGYIAGLKLKPKANSEKLGALILPPGAGNFQHMLSACLNCGLCQSACPNKIIVKTGVFGAVYIDYKQGKHYCAYNCISCSAACPSGAIKKISLAEKQKTKIAIAAITGRCISCGACIRACPTKCISRGEGKKIILNAAYCIGCGKCAAVCRPKAIEMLALAEQKRA